MIEPFRIATVPADGGRIGICRLPGGSGDLDGDLALILEWRPALVVSMTEAAELLAHGAEGLSGLLLAAGVDWRHFPIADFGVPDAGVAERWPPLAAECHAALDAAKGVLLHCRGGLGRSGMVALRLLVDRGASPEAALRLIREVRPGAVETRAQERWGADA